MGDGGLKEPRWPADSPGWLLRTPLFYSLSASQGQTSTGYVRHLLDMKYRGLISVRVHEMQRWNKLPSRPSGAFPLLFSSANLCITMRYNKWQLCLSVAEPPVDQKTHPVMYAGRCNKIHLLRIPPRKLLVNHLDSDASLSVFSVVSRWWPEQLSRSVNVVNAFAVWNGTSVLLP